MAGLASTILTIVFILAAVISLFYILYILGREKGFVHALLGFFFPPYPYFWGWMNAGRLRMADIMVFWTFVSLGAVAFPMIMAAVAAPSLAFQAGSQEFIPVSGDVNHQGPITVGRQVSGQITDLFGVDEWTYQGSKGEVINLWAAPAAGSEADPRLTVFNPIGLEIAADDDSGGNFSAAISGLQLEQSGVYRIQVDVWSAGAYVLQLDR
jgi:hypothetical protein